MDDRTLLSKAAKAAGEWSDKEPLQHIINRWNPLTDDGDALRLAVKLGITIDMHLERVRAYADELPKTAEEFFGTDPYAATRRAITRAAAALEGE